ncbi:MAG: Fe-S cluster assembly protein SufB [archaeon]
MGRDYRERYGFHVRERSVFRTDKGISEGVVREISRMKNEPDWMLQLRLSALEIFQKKRMPTWGADLSEIDFGRLTYYIRPQDKKTGKWADLPEEIRTTFDRLGVPGAEKKFLGGVGAQYESEVVYHSLRRELSRKGIIFLDMDSGLREHPELVRKYFGKIVPAADNKFSALNTAAWSGGTFLYVPKGVKVKIPLQAYFRMNAKNIGQFERTLIVADEGAEVHYVEGCTAPIYSTDSLHAAVVELVAMKGSKIRYTTIQNWSNNVYNLVTKRAHAHEGAKVEWVDGNIGSKITMKYPSVFLLGPRARADILSIAFAGRGQHQDAGGKVLHLAPDTASTIVSKSISHSGGRTSYRGKLFVQKGSTGVKSSMRCDALIIDGRSRSDTYPDIVVKERDATIGHEATVGKIGDEQIFYLMSRGIPHDEAVSLIVMGFIEGFTKELPMEYAVELNRLVRLEMGGSVG